MMYGDFIDDLAHRIDPLPRRAKAAIFWILGSSLVRGVQQPASWAAWFASAHNVGRRFVTSGEVSPTTATLWEQASAPTDDGESSQLFNSAIICLSTPLGLAINPDLVVGAWAEHAFFPLLQSVSLELFDDVAFPGEDEELDQIFATPRFQIAVEFVLDLVRRMSQTPEPDVPTLNALLDDARVLAPSREDG
jgi:hypothetical protein